MIHLLYRVQWHKSVFVNLIPYVVPNQKYVMNMGPILNGYYYYLVLWGYWHCGHSWPIVLASGDSEDGCGEADGM
jgi:hypothetical protein